MKRFAIMAVLGTLLCGSLMAGCGGGNNADETSVTNTAANGASTTTTEKDE